MVVAVEVEESCMLQMDRESRKSYGSDMPAPADKPAPAERCKECMARGLPCLSKSDGSICHEKVTFDDELQCGAGMWDCGDLIRDVVKSGDAIQLCAGDNTPHAHKDIGWNYVEMSSLQLQR